MKRITYLLPFLLSSWLIAQSELDIAVTLDMEEEEIAQAFLDLSELTDVNITFSPKIFKEEQTISVNVRNERLGRVLSKFLRGTNVGFKLEEGGILLYRKTIPRLVVSGYLTDERTGERLVGAHVYDPISGEGTTTNGFGFYSYPFSKGKRDLVISYLGYETKRESMDLVTNQQVDFALRSNLTLSEVVITGANKSADISDLSNRLEPNFIKEIPSVGESDIIRSMQLQNGVLASQDGLAGLHVRGGNSDQNLLLLDDVPIFNGAHTFGIFSIYNPDIVKSIEVFKGGFPSRFDGRLSSIIDVRTREGSTEKFTGAVEFNNILSKAYLEIPILNGKGGILIAGRRTQINPWLEPYSERKKSDRVESFGDSATVSGRMSYHFEDINVKGHFKPDSSNQFYLSYYQGADNFSNRDQFLVTSEFSDNYYGGTFTQSNSDEDTSTIDWGNKVISGRWNHLFNNRLFLNGTITYSQFNYAFERSTKSETDINIPGIESFGGFLTSNSYSSDVNDLSARYDFSFHLNHEHLLQFGGNYTRRDFIPAVTKLSLQLANLPPGYETFDIPIESEMVEIPTDEWSIYLDERYRQKNWTIEAGVRASLYRNDSFEKIFPQPRLSIEYALPNIQFKGTAIHRVQFIHLLTDSDAGLPNDVWVPATTDAQPQSVNLFTLGALGSHPNGVNWQVEAYWKDMDHLIRLNDNIEDDPESPQNVFTISPDNWESHIEFGQGHSRGVEFSLGKSTKQFRANAGYTLSKTTRTFNDVESLFSFDNLHSLKLLGSLNFLGNFNVSANWVFESGRPNNLEFYSQNNLPYLQLLSTEQEADLSNDRLPAYHRLDLSITGKFGRLFSHKIKAGLYNLYDRRNVFFVTERSDEYGTGSNNVVYSLPRIPSLSYSFSW